MGNFFVILSLIINSLIIYYISKKISIKRKWLNYKNDVIKLTSSINNIKTDDLDSLSKNGLILLFNLGLLILPYLFAYFSIFKLTLNQIQSLLVSSFVFLPFLIKKNK